MLEPTPHAAAAIVTGPHRDDAPDRYLLVSAGGQHVWIEDPEAATSFPSMREATRMAMRLPSSCKAFSLPRDPEISLLAH